ncbi:MAG: RNaseH domain-containing protein [Cyanobacteria bacterium J06635_10]
MHENLPSELEREYKFTSSEKQRLSIVRLRESNRNEVPVTIVKDSPGSKSSGIFKWNDLCDDSQQNIYLSIRKALNTEQGVLKKAESRLDDGNKPAANRKPLEIVIVYNSGIEQDILVKFVHNLRDRYASK